LSLITIIQDALAECGETAIPQTVIGNSDATAVKALAIVKGLGRDLCKQYKWPELKVDYQFETVINQAAYALPSDFQRMVPLTQWDFTAKWALNGSATDSFWAALQSGIITVGLRMWFRLQGSNFVLAPTPTDVRTINYTYFRNTWVSSASGTAQTSFLADTDYPVFMPNGNAEELLRLGLIYKWKASNGLPYADDKGNYLSAIDADTFDAQELPIIDTTGIIRYTVGRGNIPETGFGGV
jgi:hypothetical protein